MRDSTLPLCKYRHVANHVQSLSSAADTFVHKLTVAGGNRVTTVRIITGVHPPKHMAHAASSSHHTCLLNLPELLSTSFPMLPRKLPEPPSPPPLSVRRLRRDCEEGRKVCRQVKYGVQAKAREH